MPARFAATRLTGIRAGFVPLVRLERTDTRGPSVWVELHLVADGEALAAQGAGDDRAGPGDREHPVDEQAGSRILRSRRVGQQLVERRPEVVEALAGLRRDADDASIGQDGAVEPLADLLLRQVEAVVVDEVPLRERDDAARDTQDVEDREVLFRLLTPSLVGGDDEQDQSNGPDAGEHVGDETLVPRHVHEADLAPGGKLAPRVAEIDREPSPLLLVPAVRVHPGEPHDQRGLAVVDVAGRGHDAELRHLLVEVVVVAPVASEP